MRRIIWSSGVRPGGCCAYRASGMKAEAPTAAKAESLSRPVERTRTVPPGVPKSSNSLLPSVTHTKQRGGECFPQSGTVRQDAKAKSGYMVDELAKCQAKLGGNYLSAFPRSEEQTSELQLGQYLV